MNTIRSNPAFLEQYNKIEKQVKEYKRLYTSSNSTQRLVDPNGNITIPIVVHIIHGVGQAIGTGTNLSDAQVQSQIDVLNEDFSRMNPDAGLTPNAFTGVASNTMITFRLACQDPNGFGTTGITRTASPTTNFTGNNMKFNSSNGRDAWATDRYLNVWVVQGFAGNAIGFAQPITQFSSSPNTDGVVVRADCFGRGAGFTLLPQFNLGRTLTHEVGHWMSLIHVWGPNNGNPTDTQTCNDSDECNDTPNQLGPNFNIPALNTASCGNGGDMFMNFMDIPDDVVLNLFTNDQRVRMRSVFMLGGVRASFIDNYFRLAKLFSDCSLGYYLVQTPFCEANGNISWSITGPSTTSTYPSTFKTVYPQSGANGIAILTASWNNFTSDIPIIVGYGEASGSYTPNYPQSGYVPLTVNQVHPTKYNRFTYGQVSYTGATGQAQNWRFLTNSSSSTTISGGNGNSFWIRFAQAGAFATIRADIPTACGLRTVDYSFTSNLGGGYQYALSPNPASNNITITALNVSADPNARTTSEMPEYEVQIFTRYNQLMKKTKCPKGSKDITIDVSNLPSNQLYTVQFISSEDVQTKSFFKE